MYGPSSSAPRLNPYEPWNRWLYQQLPRCPSLSDADFDDVLRRLAEVPAPDSPERVEDLRRSRLGITIPNLVQTLCRIAIARGTGADAGRIGSRAERLWYATRHLDRAFNSRAFHTFFRAADAPGVGTDLRNDVVGAALERLPAFPGENPEDVERFFVGMLSHAIDRGEIALIERILRAVELRQLHSWATLARLAGQKNGPGVLPAVWRATKEVRHAFDVTTWAEFARAAAVVRDGELLDELWAESEPVRVYFDNGAWSAFLGAAAAAESDLLDEILEARATLELEALAEDGAGSDERKDARLARIRELLNGGSAPANPDEWGFLAMAAVRAERPELLPALWDAREQRQAPLSSAAWGLWVNAAATAGLGWLVEAIWVASWADRRRFDPHAWGSFAKAAVAIASPALLEEVWQASEPIRSSFATVHAVWGGFVSGAVALELPGMLRAVFRSLRPYFDPTRLPHWGTLYRPLLVAARSVPDPEVRDEILETLRNRRVDVRYCLRVMRDVAPHRLGEPGGQFEGACRTLMRFLVASYFFEREERFAADVTRIVQGISALPYPARDPAWIQLLGRGQEAHGAMVRARGADALREAVGPLETWGRMTTTERSAFLDDLRRDDGVVMRISRLVTETVTEMLERVLVGEAPKRYAPLTAYLVTNHVAFLEAKSSEGDYWAGLQEVLERSVGCDLQDVDWEAVVTEVIQALAGAVTDRTRPAISRLLHDVPKAACENAHRRLLEPDISPAEQEMIGNAVMNLFRGFDGAISRTATPPRERTAMNVAAVIRSRLIGKRAWSELAQVELPRAVRIFIPLGARQEELEPLFSAIRANYESALHTLTPDRQHFRCAVAQDGAWVQFVVENAYDPAAPPNPYSTRVGLASIEQRVLALDGVFAEPEQDAEADPPRFRIRFALPAAGGDSTPTANGHGHAADE